MTFSFGTSVTYSVHEFSIRIIFGVVSAPLSVCAALLFLGELVICSGTFHPVVFRAPPSPLSRPPGRGIVTERGTQELPSPIEAAAWS
jgi:hypothetical protein